MEGEEGKVDGRGRKENVQDQKMRVMEKGEKQRQNTFTPQIEKRSRGQRHKGRKTGFRGEVMQR